MFIGEKQEMRGLACMDPRPARSKLGKRLIVAGQVVLTTTALVIAARTLHWNDICAKTNGDSTKNFSANSINEPGLRTLLTRTDSAMCAATLICGAACTGVLIWRWWLLWSGPRAPGVLAFAKTYIRGQAVALLPTSEVGSDAYRVIWGASWSKNAPRMLALLVLERLCGLAGLSLTVLIGFIWLLGERPKEAELIRQWLGLPLLLVGGTCIFALVFWRHAVRIGMYILRKFSGNAAAIHLRQIRVLILIQVLVLSVVAHVVGAIVFAFTDRALGLATPFWCYLLAIPCVNLARCLPIHVAGIGVVEGGLWVMLHPWAGRTLEEIAAISMLNRAVSLAWIALANVVVSVAGVVASQRGPGALLTSK